MKKLQAMRFWSRSDVLLGGQVACSFIENRVLKVTRGWPWRLCRGNIEQKLSDLGLLSEPPPEALAAKVYELVRQGSPGWVCNSQRSTCSQGSLAFERHSSVHSFDRLSANAFWNPLVSKMQAERFRCPQATTSSC